jgi:hypothetical protein
MLGVSRFTSLILAFAIYFPVFASAGESTFEKELHPLLDAHCFRCHGEKKQKGGVNLAPFRSEEDVLKKHKLFRSVLEQIETESMPPDEEDALPEAERTKLLAGIRQTLATLESDHPSLLNPGPGTIRRLSRTEYNYSIRDLLGVDFDAKEAVGMPEDNTGRGYANFAAALNIPPAVMEKYFSAADAILARLYRDPDTKSPDKGKDERAYKALFENVPEDREGARQLLSRLLRRAYRKPVEAGQVERLLKFYDQATAKGEAFPAAVRRALKPIFVSPYFLFRVEENRAPEGSREVYPVSAIELASRLSYFLWSSAPDETLLALAETGELLKPQTLEAEVKRMLADPKARALTDHFTTKWLQLDLLNEARPSTEFFPSFNWDMRQAMKEEVATFADKLRAEDRSILDFLNADYTFANEQLAKHYGIDGVKGGEFQKVALKPEQQRGGVLGMAGILALTSHTNRTSPTQRGKWVLEVIFGTPPSPPPANVSQIDENKKSSDGKTPATFREKLALHAADATCAAAIRRSIRSASA